VAAFWRHLVRAVLLVVGLGVVGLIAWALAAQASATRQVATAATVSAAGSTAGNVAATLLALLLALAVIGGGGYIAVLRWQLRRARPMAADSGRGWLPGPNAQWSRLEGGSATQGGGDALGMLVQIEVLRALRDLRGGAPSAAPWAALPGDDGSGYDDDTGADDYARNQAPLWW
jgi:hypothetical protein